MACSAPGNRPEGSTRSGCQRSSVIPRGFDHAGTAVFYSCPNGFSRGIYWAHQLYHDDSPTRWAMEAYLLSRETDAQIGFLLGCPPEVVEAYEALFFDVRSKLQHPDYIINVVIGPQIHQGLGSRDIGALWKLCGYQGGPYVVDELIGKCRSREKSARRPEQTGNFFSETTCDSVLMKTALTALSMPIPSSTKQQLKLLKQLPQVIKVAAYHQVRRDPGTWKRRSRR